jgi:hypothetical protein
MFEFPLFNAPRDDGLSNIARDVSCWKEGVGFRDLCCLLSLWWKGRWMHWAEYWTQGGEQTSCTARDDQCAHLPSRSQLPSHHVTIFLAPLPIWPKQYMCMLQTHLTLRFEVQSPLTTCHTVDEPNMFLMGIADSTRFSVSWIIWHLQDQAGRF